MVTNYYDAVVVGSGAAGLSAAVRLKELGKNVALICENLKAGTSRNTGSDKQTYYKLSTGGNDPDSVMKMAENLFSFGSVDGDNALCEAALSTRCFFSLVEGGVPFPHNRYGEYVGYKTDHDPFRRATSAGPLTSKFMTEMWERKALEVGLTILDKRLATEVLKNDNKVCGLIMLNKETGESEAICTPYVVLAVGGPAGIYRDSVYPESQTGATSLAIDAGASLQNLTEWQYGLASTKPRWNVSGTYMQVLPRFVSIDENGNEYEFLSEYFKDEYEALSNVFLKGYQWPFDSKKLYDGSSIIDLLVFYECSVKNRKVYLDFTKNPFGLDHLEYEKLSEAAYTYLKNAEAMFGTPIARLEKMNMPAIELYKSKGVDITREYLEIALCSQHHNGGIAVDRWWQTCVDGLFAIGECAGTHGISRPGGSALNAGQVGALRVSQYIDKMAEKADEKAFALIASEAINKHTAFIKECLNNDTNADELIAYARGKMSDVGSAIRDNDKIAGYLSEIDSLLTGSVGVKNEKQLYKAYKYLDILKTQRAVLSAMLHFSLMDVSSRGSAIICDKNGILPKGLDEMFRYRISDKIFADKIQEVRNDDGEIEVTLRDARPIPTEDDFFENVWRTYRQNKCVY